MFIFAVVRREKETELNNARNNYETELKRKISNAQRTVDVAKVHNNDMEIRKIKHKYEQELKAKEEVQALVCRDYQERDQAWQLEKQVIHHFPKSVILHTSMYLSIIVHV